MQLLSAQKLMSAVSVACLILAFTAEELLGYQSISLGIYSGTDDVLTLDSYLLMCIVQGLAALVVFVALPRFSRVSMGILVVVACIFAALGAACVMLGIASHAPFAPLVGFVALALAALAAKFAGLLLLTRIPSAFNKKVLFCAVAVQALVSPLFVGRVHGDWMVAGALIVGCVLAAWWVYGSWDILPESAQNQKFRKQTTPSTKLIVGFGLTFVCLAFLNPIRAYDMLSEAGFTLLVLGTHVTSALLFGLFVFKLEDPAYVTTAKVLCSLLAFALILFAVAGGASGFSFFISSMVLSTFEFVLFYVVADIASYSKSAPLRVYAAYYALYRFATFIGLAAALLAGGQFATGGGFAVVTAAIGVLLIIASMWLIDESALNEFAWGPSPDTDSRPDEACDDAAQEAFGRTMETVSERYGLTERESEVLWLFALGRSSTFIAEQLVISVNTVRKHVASIYRKCGVHSKQELLTLVQSIR